jgi:hypothetical protein
VTSDVQRDPIFTLRLVGLQLALSVMLSWSAFWMERSSLADRISEPFVGTLTAVAYQILVGDLLPHVSYITVMHAFLNFSFFVMCSTLVINLIVEACDRNGKNALGDHIDRRCRWIFPLTYLGLLLVIAVIAALCSKTLSYIHLAFSSCLPRCPPQVPRLKSLLLGNGFSGEGGGKGLAVRSPLRPSPEPSTSAALRKAIAGPPA